MDQVFMFSIQSTTGIIVPSFTTLTIQLLVISSFMFMEIFTSENFPEWLRMAEARTEFSAKLTELVLLVQMRLQSVTELQQVIQNGSEQFMLRMQQ